MGVGGAILLGSAVLAVVSAAAVPFAFVPSAPGLSSLLNLRRPSTTAASVRLGERIDAVTANTRHCGSSGGTALRMGLLDGLLGASGDAKPTSSSASDSSPTSTSSAKVVVGDNIGTGSYGTVHLCTLEPAPDDGGQNLDSTTMVAKRAWTVEELHHRTKKAMTEDEKSTGTPGSVSGSSSSSGSKEERDGTEDDDPLDPSKLQQRAERCRYYLDVERHCLAKMRNFYLDREGGQGYLDDDSECVPNLLGTYLDGEGEGRDWLVFDLVGRRPIIDAGDSSNGPDDPTPVTTPVVARTLAQVLDEDWSDQHAQDEADPSSHHHLYVLQREFNLTDDSTFGDTLDVAFLELLRCAKVTNGANIVHRDIKPQNLLVRGRGERKEGFTLIDFGSAADLDPLSGSGGAGLNLGAALGGNGNRVGLEDDAVVALSPIYAAPEVFVRWDRAPLNFDTFSSALVFMQLMFNLLDERTDAAFRQQLEDAEFDLDAWLKRELASKFRPDGIDDAIMYLGERPGLWNLLRDMVHPNPERRASSAEAFARFEGILAKVEEEGTATAAKSIEDADGAFFAGVVSSVETCIIPDMMYEKQETKEKEKEEGQVAVVPEDQVKTAEADLVIPRPLHFVATFDRSASLGLLLSEAVGTEDEDDDEAEEMDDAVRAAWDLATANANPGEVYVKGIVENGQAEEIGVFEIGDRLMGVGEFPFTNGGFGDVVEMLKRQPPSAKTVTLHFDRKSVGRSHAYEKTAPHLAKVVGQGAWSSLGRRKAQEDRYILHEIHDEDGNAALLTGVFDGHGGNAASTTLAQILPSLFSAELAAYTSDGKATSDDLKAALLSAYEITCETYRMGCDEEGTCVADYDPTEGIIVAGTGAKDLVAGSTVTTAVMSVSEDGADNLTVLNCGDSRTLVVGRPRGASPGESVVHFSTRDHAPNDELEMERLLFGKDKGFSQPKCSMSRWRLKVGDYQYALSRSLEGSFATSKGIVSDPDVSQVNLSAMLSERKLGVIIIASDGLFEVVDNEEAGREILKMREAGQTADEAAKNLCRLAIGKGTSDNVSVVVIYLD